MDEVPSPLEGKFVVLSYLEVDYTSEGNACLVYKVEQGKLEPLLGVLDLPEGVSGWHTDTYDQYQVATQIILEQVVTEVYTPTWTSKFLGLSFGDIALSEGVNDKDEIECWCQFGPLSNPDMERYLEEAGIKVRYVDGVTLEVYPA